MTYAYDGILGGTFLFEFDIQNDTLPAQVRALAVIGEMNNELYFVGRTGAFGDELWKTDGTQQGTVLVKDVNPGNAHGLQSRYFKIAGNRLFFYGITPTEGNELWISDGTGAGTQLVKDIFPGAGSSIDFANGTHLFAALGSSLIFFANEGQHDVQAWISDGTPAGTHLLKEISPGTHVYGNTQPQSVELNQKLYFSARRVHPVIQTPYEEIWVTNGTEAGTLQVTDLESAENAFARVVDTLNGKVIYTIEDSDQPLVAGLYAYSGTGNPLRISATVPFHENVVHANQKMYFVAADSSLSPDTYMEVFATTGNLNGTFIEKNIQNGPARETSRLLGKFQDYIFVVSCHLDSSSRNRLFYFHPDSQAFYPLAPPGALHQNPGGTTSFLFDNDSTAYIDCYFDASGEALWKIQRTLTSGLSVTPENSAGGSVYPNPVTQREFHISGDLSKLTGLKVVSAEGRIILLQQKKSLPVRLPDTLLPGIYSVVLLWEDGHQTVEKIVVL